jgi:hypothetical protein
VTINSRRYFAFSNWTEVEHHRVMNVPRDQTWMVTRYLRS